MKKVLLLSLFLLSSISFGQQDGISKEMCTKLVEQTCKDIKAAANPKTILDKITAGEAPYKDAKNTELYSFVYNEAVDIIAHPTKDLVGKNYKGKPDVRGKNFRDLIVQGAMTKGTGWVSYTYQKPGSTGEFRKEAYFQKCEAKDEKGAPMNYIVVSGRYEN